MEAIGDDGTYDYDSVRPAVDVADSGYTYFEQGDVVRARVTPCFENGKGALLSTLTGDRGLGTTELFVFKPSRKIDPRFLYYVVASQEFTDQGTATLYGAHGVRRVDDQFARDYRVWAPSVDTQRAVADYLDRETARIDALIAVKRRMVGLLEERLQGAVSEATHARSVADPAHRLPDDWQLLPLKRCLGSAVYGIGEASQAEGEYAVLGMTNISSGEIVGSPGGFVSAVDDGLLLASGDLLFNRTNSRELVGKVGLVRSLDQPTTFASYLVRLRANKLADAQYLNYLLNAREVLGIARSMALPSIGQANLNPNRYSAIVLPIPPIDEQHRCVSHLNTLASRIAEMRRTLERQAVLLQERRQALITAAVTGQLDIQEAA
jgi:type I restriction enzyme S subunit